MKFGSGGGWNSLKSLASNAVDVMTQGAASKHLGEATWQQDESIVVFSDLPTEL